MYPGRYGNSRLDAGGGSVVVNADGTISITGNTVVTGTLRSTSDFLAGNSVTNPASGFANQKGLGFKASTGALQASASNNVPLALGRFGGFGILQQFLYAAVEIGGFSTPDGVALDADMTGSYNLKNAAEGGTGELTLASTRQVVAMGTGSTAVSTSISVPSGARLIAVALNVDVAIVTAGNNTWGAAFSTGSTTTIASAGRAATQNTKITLMLDDEVTSGVAEITFTPNGATFTSGSIEAVVWYEKLTALSNA